MDTALSPSIARDGARTTVPAGVADDRTLLTVGGLCGVLAVLLYLSSQLFGDVLHEFPVRASRAEVVAVWWLATLWGPLAIAMLYAFHRLLARERAGAVNDVAFVYGVVAFTLVVLMVMVQAAVLLKASDLALDGPAADVEAWHDTARVARGVDWGLDVAWDLFLGLWMLLTAVLMRGHSRLGRRWAVPAIVLAVALLGLNAVTVPFPPASEGLVDPGPIVGIYYLGLSAYLFKLGREKLHVPATAAAGHASPSGTVPILETLDNGRPATGKPCRLGRDLGSAFRSREPVSRRTGREESEHEEAIDRWSLADQRSAPVAGGRRLGSGATARKRDHGHPRTENHDRDALHERP